MFKKLALALLVAIVGLGILLVTKTLVFRSRQVAVEPASITVDATEVAGRLAGALQFRTISHQDSAAFDAAEFARFHQYLMRTFPRLDTGLSRETVAGSSLLYRWAGSDTTLAPVILMAHQDVVPVEPGTEGDWTHPAFSGAIADGYIWGRGAMDNKGNLVAQLEAVETLLARGYAPRRTIFLAFGHDEEVGGLLGAVRIVELLRSRGVRPAFVVDEGGALADGLIPGLGHPVALIGIAEKGYVSLELSVRVEGGHSSMPPAQTAVGILAAAVRRLEQNQMPRGIRDVTAAMFDHLGPEMPFGPRLAMANRWLFGSMIERQFGASPQGNALLRTTTAPTIFQAGVKENVLPSSAAAVVNFRILPGDSTTTVIAHVRRTIADPRIQVRPLRFQSEPSPVSSAESEHFQLLARTIRQIVPTAVVTPWLVVGGTDSRHFTALTSNVYRVGVTRVGPGDLRRAHGTDERVSVEGYAEMVRFYMQFLQNAAM